MNTVRRRSPIWPILAVVLALLLLLTGWLCVNLYRHARFRNLSEEGASLISQLASHRPEGASPAAWNVAVDEVVRTAWVNVLNWPSDVVCGPWPPASRPRRWQR